MHVRAELDVLSETSQSEWLVQLHYSFQEPLRPLHTRARPPLRRSPRRREPPSSPEEACEQCLKRRSACVPPPQDEANLYLVMEYVPGGDMMSLLMR